MIKYLRKYKNKKEIYKNPAKNKLNVRGTKSKIQLN
jgi:hypothetical protein